MPVDYRTSQYTLTGVENPITLYQLGGALGIPEDRINALLSNQAIYTPGMTREAASRQMNTQVPTGLSPMDAVGYQYVPADVVGPGIESYTPSDVGSADWNQFNQLQQGSYAWTTPPQGENEALLLGLAQTRPDIGVNLDDPIQAKNIMQFAMAGRGAGGTPGTYGLEQLMGSSEVTHEPKESLLDTIMPMIVKGFLGTALTAGLGTVGGALAGGLSSATGAGLEAITALGTKLGSYFGSGLAGGLTGDPDQFLKNVGIGTATAGVMDFAKGAAGDVFNMAKDALGFDMPQIAELPNLTRPDQFQPNITADQAAMGMIGNVITPDPNELYRINALRQSMDAGQGGRGGINDISARGDMMWGDEFTAGFDADEFNRNFGAADVGIGGMTVDNGFGGSWSEARQVAAGIGKSVLSGLGSYLSQPSGGGVPTNIASSYINTGGLGSRWTTAGQIDPLSELQQRGTTPSGSRGLG